MRMIGVSSSRPLIDIVQPPEDPLAPVSRETVPAPAPVAPRQRSTAEKCACPLAADGDSPLNSLNHGLTPRDAMARSNRFPNSRRAFLQYEWILLPLRQTSRDTCNEVLRCLLSQKVSASVR